MSSTFSSVTVFGREFHYRSEVPVAKVVAFLSKLNFNGDNGCWVWCGAVTLGYGRTTADGKSAAAHRVSYSMFVGSVPVGLHVHHKCGNTRCVNPEHLQIVTPFEHIALTPSNPVHHSLTGDFCAEGHDLRVHGYTYPNSTKRCCRLCKAERARIRYRQRRDSELGRAFRAGARTHCSNGHELTNDNVYVYLGGKFCRACHYARSMEYAERKRQERAAKPAGAPDPRKLVCPYGHAKTEDNVLVSGGNRYCKTCHKQQGRITYLRRKQRFGASKPAEDAELTTLLAGRWAAVPA